MITFRACLSVSCVALALYAPTSSADILATASAGSSISGVIDQLKSAAEKIIHDLDNTVNVNAFRIRQDMQIVISDLNYAAQELEGKVVKDLNDSQRLFFSQSESLIHGAASAANASIDKLEDAQIRLSDSIRDLPFARRTARVLQVEPTYVESTFAGKIDNNTTDLNIMSMGDTLSLKEQLKLEQKQISDPPILDERQQSMLKALTASELKSQFGGMSGENFSNSIEISAELKNFLQNAPLGTHNVYTPEIWSKSIEPSTEVKNFLRKGAVEALKLDKPDMFGQFKDVSITIKGSDLNYGPASLSFGDTSCFSVEQLDSKLTFKCPGLAFISNSAIEGRIGELVVIDYQPWYTRFWNWITSTPAATRIFKTYVTVVPQKVGDYSVTAVVQTPKPVEEAVSEAIAVGNSHCAGERSYVVRVNRRGDASWTIDYKTVSVVENSGNQGRSVDGPLETSPGGFIMSIKLQNGGSCGPNRPFSGDKLWYDARAWFNGTVSWKEKKTLQELVPTQIRAGEMFWGKDIDLKLPEGTQSFKVTVNQINQMTQTVLGEDKKPWFRVQGDGTKTFLVISPAKLTDALR